MFVEILRELPRDQIVATEDGEDWTVAHEHIAYGISGARITIISMSQFGPGSYFTQQQFDYLARIGNRLATTAGFALERLAGTRRVTANAVPLASGSPKRLRRPRGGTPPSRRSGRFRVKGPNAWITTCCEPE